MLKLSIWSSYSVDTKVHQNMPLMKIVRFTITYAVLEYSYSFSWTNVNLKKEKAQLIWDGGIGMFSMFFFFFFNFEFILFSLDRNSIGINITLITAFWLCRTPVREKGGMCLWNGMWHGLRNDIIMQNVIYADCLKEIN